MKPVCCICTGRHHPANCVQAHAILDQCAEPTPDDYAGPVIATASTRDAIVADLAAHRVQRKQRSELPAAERSGRRAERHRRRGRMIS